MTDNRNDTVTNALKRIHSRFELINVAARRAREIQNYEAEYSKAKIDLRKTPVLAIANARVNQQSGGPKNQVEARVKELEQNPIKVFVEREEGEKPTITALREIEIGAVDKEYLERQSQLNKVAKDKEIFDEAEKLAHSTDIAEFELEDDIDLNIDFNSDEEFKFN